ncbi:tail length tape measure protein [Escherichia phage vB_EcoS_W011D]|uniref:Tape measure chaperone n=2 Tax=Changchunvirus TaxID=2842593 RepID=A0A4Y5NVF3_9CAUD|nr:tail length tape measure protein [Escherichia phage vB_EcoS_W011D]QCW18521.1 tape measure chaperone [Escherichia phage vB_EcoS_W011D]
MEAVGLTRADYEGEEPPEIIFDESMMQSWDMFCAMQTQWRSAGAGAYGFDYNVLPMLFKIYKIDDEEMALNDLRIMESKALEMMHASK